MRDEEQFKAIDPDNECDKLLDVGYDIIVVIIIIISSLVSFFSVTMVKMKGS